MLGFYRIFLAGFLYRTSFFPDPQFWHSGEGGGLLSIGLKLSSRTILGWGVGILFFFFHTSDNMSHKSEADHKSEAGDFGKKCGGPIFHIKLGPPPPICKLAHVSFFYKCLLWCYGGRAPPGPQPIYTENLKSPSADWVYYTLSPETHAPPLWKNPLYETPNS